MQNKQALEPAVIFQRLLFGLVLVCFFQVEVVFRMQVVFHCICIKLKELHLICSGC